MEATSSEALVLEPVATRPQTAQPQKRLTFDHEEQIPSRIKVLLDDARSFQSNQNFHILEPVNKQWEHKTVSDLAAEVKSWPKKGGNTKIIIAAGHDQRESTFPITTTQPTSCFPITIPQDVFKSLLSRAGIPLIYAAILFQHNARYMNFANGKRAGFIVHMRNPGFSYAVSYPEAPDQSMVPDSACADGSEDVDDDTIYGIVQGLREIDIKMLVEEIQSSCPGSWTPAMIATCLLEMLGVWTNRDSSRIYGKLRNCEVELQTKSDSLLRRPDRERYWFKGFNFDPLTSDLTIIATSLARVQHQADYAKSMIQVVEAANRDKHVCYSNDALSTRIADLESWFEVLKSEAVFYQTRTEANRQTVFNLIQQQDNLTNVVISQTNLLESNAMKILAKATARDSSQMLFFSVITFILLPATFTGTFFSTTFFSFQDDGWTYSSKLWIYFATTVPLGLAIGISWWIYLRIHGNDMEKKLQNIEKEEQNGFTS
jgi:hypothetical protein